MKKLTDVVNNVIGLSAGTSFLLANGANLVVGVINGDRNVSGQEGVFPFTYLCGLTALAAGMSYFSVPQRPKGETLAERLKLSAIMAGVYGALAAPLEYGAGWVVGAMHRLTVDNLNSAGFYIG